MDIQELKKYTNNLEKYSAADVDSLEFMTDEELEDYQREVEHDSGNVSNFDHIRAIITYKEKIDFWKDLVESCECSN